MKLNVMTLQQAENFLKDTPYPFPAATIRRAVMDGKLTANLVRASTSYYTVVEDDLLEWASNPAIDKPAPKSE